MNNDQVLRRIMHMDQRQIDGMVRTVFSLEKLDDIGKLTRQLMFKRLSKSDPRLKHP